MLSKISMSHMILISSSSPLKPIIVDLCILEKALPVKLFNECKQNELQKIVKVKKNEIVSSILSYPYIYASEWTPNYLKISSDIFICVDTIMLYNFWCVYLTRNHVCNRLPCYSMPDTFMPEFFLSFVTRGHQNWGLKIFS